MKPITVDAHHHLWDLGGSLGYDWLSTPGLEPIHRTYRPEDLQPLLKAAGIDQSIFVQTLANLNETRWALDQARHFPFLAGVVGWVDLTSPDCQRQVEEFQADPHFVGVRHVVHDEPDRDWILRPDVIRGLRVLESRGIPFDVLFRVEHLHHVPTLARALPDLPMVIDHLAKPAIKAGRLDGWIANFRAAAQFPNVHCKLSGMVSEADRHAWRASDFRPYVAAALDLFGPSRLMFGSDWPVCELAGTYAQVHQLARDLLGDLTDTEQEAIFGGNATRFYRLSVPETSAMGTP